MATVVVALVAGREPPRFVLVAAGLAGGSVGALLSIAVRKRLARGNDPGPTDSARSWFHPGAAGVALGLASAIVLGWGVALEAVIPGYGAATSVALLSYALVASALPRR